MALTYNFSQIRGDTFKGKEFQISRAVGVSTFAALPLTGEAGVVYKTIDTGLHYEWDTTEYVETTNRNYIDFTDCEILCQLRTTPLTPVVYTMATFITDAVNGKIRMGSQIIDIVGKAYVYDVQITFPSGVVETFISGVCTIVDDVSRLI